MIKRDATLKHHQQKSINLLYNCLLVYISKIKHLHCLRGSDFLIESQQISREKKVIFIRLSRLKRYGSILLYRIASIFKIQNNNQSCIYKKLGTYISNNV